MLPREHFLDTIPSLLLLCSNIQLVVRICSLFGLLGPYFPLFLSLGLFVRLFLLVGYIIIHTVRDARFPRQFESNEFEYAHSSTGVLLGPCGSKQWDIDGPHGMRANGRTTGGHAFRQGPP